jgi:hypothetical protein
MTTTTWQRVVEIIVALGVSAFVLAAMYAASVHARFFDRPAPAVCSHVFGAFANPDQRCRWCGHKVREHQSEIARTATAHSRRASNLVTRLRAVPPDTVTIWKDQVGRDCHEAADELARYSAEYTQLNAVYFQQKAENEQLRAALTEVIPMLDLAAGTHGTESANPRYQAAEALKIIHKALKAAPPAETKP